jgi:hypothetical protein
MKADIYSWLFQNINYIYFVYFSFIYTIIYNINIISFVFKGKLWHSLIVITIAKDIKLVIRYDRVFSL